MTQPPLSRFVGSIEHPTATTCGTSITNPLPEHIEIAFHYAIRSGEGRVGDIWIKWNKEDKEGKEGKEGKLVEFKELMIAVSKEHNCCFMARGIEQVSHYENLVWSQRDGDDEIISIEDSGCADWYFKVGSKVPIAEGIAIAKRFAADGDICDELKWEVSPC